MSIIYQSFFSTKIKNNNRSLAMKKLLTSITSSNEYSSILMFIYVLNITDYLFTLLMISSGILSGYDPYPVSSAGIFADLLLKCLLPLFLLLCLRIGTGLFKPRHPKLLTLFLYLMLCYFFVLNIFHIFRLCYAYFLF